MQDGLNLVVPLIRREIAGKGIWLAMEDLMVYIDHGLGDTIHKMGSGHYLGHAELEMLFRIKISHSQCMYNSYGGH